MDSTISRRRLVIAKLAFFLGGLSGVGWNRFSTNFLLEHGYTPKEISGFKLLSLALKAFPQPVWAAAADLHGTVPTMIASLVFAVASLEGLRLTVVNNAAIQYVVLARIMRSILPTSVSTTFVLQILKGTDEGFGRQRLFGSLAWGTGGLLTGILIDSFGMNIGLFYFSYLINFLYIGMLVYVGRSGAVSDCTSPQSTSKDDASKRSSCRHLSEVAGYAASCVRIIVPSGKHGLATSILLINTACVGVIMVLMDSIVFIQMESEFHMSRTSSGANNFVTVLLSYPAYWYSSSVLRRYGHWSVLLVSQLLIVPRLVLHGLVDEGNCMWLLPLANLFHGLIFAGVTVANVELMDALAPPELRTMVQTFLHNMYFTIGGGVGNALWGSLYGAYGPRRLYLLGVVLTLGNALLLWVVAFRRRDIFVGHQRQGKDKDGAEELMQEVELKATA
eukprot:TRINITY_DN24434_c0_g1_i1.p1 TRINITY_DN24434_c0_g1~~TRINITY_DN24434_c0_g1_i1.p1  ORF type:complete len:447 (-),score=54.79 TRINITY_DN24434_c0_g1_i1:196-1536(-)